jgi:LysR family transcriptional activator of nhaA
VAVEWLNYHHLLYFWTTAREGSVSQASKTLHVTPATVSIQIRELEKDLGVRLFEKSGRGLALTAMGEAVYQYASDIFAQGRELVDMVRGRPVGWPLVLRVGIKDVMPKVVAFGLIEPSLRLVEPLRLICREGDFESLVADLAIHKLDVVISDTPLDAHLRIRAFSHLLGESEVVIVGTRKWVDRLKDDFPSSLQKAPWLLPTDNNVLRRSLDAWFSEQGFRPDIRGEFEDSAMLKIAGKAGLGVFAVAAAIRSDVQAMYGVEVIGRIPSIKERFYAISAERKNKHPGVIAISEGARKKLK